MRPLPFDAWAGLNRRPAGAAKRTQFPDGSLAAGHTAMLGREIVQVRSNQLALHIIDLEIV
jgi:hypothetical protein